MAPAVHAGLFDRDEPLLQFSLCCLLSRQWRAYIVLVISVSSEKPHSQESFLMILAALPTLNLTAVSMMQPEAIFSSSHAGCSIARRSGRSKLIKKADQRARRAGVRARAAYEIAQRPLLVLGRVGYTFSKWPQVRH